MESKYTAETIADWLLSKSEMSPKKLQKMLYYSYTWVLTLMNEAEESLENELFEEDFEAWVHGPVIPSIYQKYRPYGYQDIPKSNKEVEIDDEEIVDILEQVYATYGGYNGNELESISHQEKPWLEAREGKEPYEACNDIISKETIFNFYIQRVVE
ncbi:Panacea domain-containing protein [Planococcus plakortidis]